MSSQTDNFSLEDDTSFDDFLARVRPRVGYLLRRYQIPPEEAEDLFQQALLAMLYKRNEVRSPEAWLIGTLRNKCRLYWRHRRRDVCEAVDYAVLEWAADPQPPVQLERDLRRDLVSLIAQLPERCQGVLRLRYGLGYASTEVADVMGYRHSSIRKVTHRCLAALARQLSAAGIFASSAAIEEL